MTARAGDVEALVARIPDGASLVMPSATNGQPMAAVRALLRQGARDLHPIGGPTNGLAAASRSKDSAPSVGSPVSCANRTRGNRSNGFRGDISRPRPLYSRLAIQLPSRHERYVIGTKA